MFDDTQGVRGDSRRGRAVRLIDARRTSAYPTTFGKVRNPAAPPAWRAFSARRDGLYRAWNPEFDSLRRRTARRGFNFYLPDYFSRRDRRRTALSRNCIRHRNFVTPRQHF